MLVLLTATSAGAQVQLGNEVMAAGGFKELQEKRVGLITNPSGRVAGPFALWHYAQAHIVNAERPRCAGL